MDGRLEKLSTFTKKKDGQAYIGSVLPGDIYMSSGFTVGMCNHVIFLKFSFPNSGYLQNLVSPMDNLFNKTASEVMAVINKEIFKLPQELLIKTAIECYIKKLTVSFVFESYFLYDKNSGIEPTLITETNKLISVYGSVSYWQNSESESEQEKSTDIKEIEEQNKQPPQKQEQQREQQTNKIKIKIFDYLNSTICFALSQQR